MPATALPETLSLVYHARDPHPRQVPLAEVYRVLDVPSRPDRPAVILNMVQTLDGAVAEDGTAWTIGSEVDHYLFRTLRGWADVVLSGAETLRRNDIVATTHPHLQERRAAEGRPRNPAAIVVSRRGAFGERGLSKAFFTRDDFESIVLTTDRASAEDRRRIEAAGGKVWIVPAAASGDVDLTAALSALRGRGVDRVLAEGGPGLNRRLAHARLIDELFLTVAPRIAGVPDAPRLLAGIFGGARARLELISEYQVRDGGVREWFFRFAVSGP